jgi:hypothetical protein
MELNPEKSFIIFSTAKRQNYTFQNPDRHWPFLLPRFRLLFAATVPLLFPLAPVRHSPAGRRN